MIGQDTIVFGIDIGTTYSRIANVDEFGQPVVLTNAEGQRTTPSVVYFDGEDRIVGEEAKNSAVVYPDQVVELVKRHMGEEGWRFHYEGIDYTPEEVSSYILRKLAADVKERLGTEVTDVVITCPAYFGINQREATAKAGEIAGFKVWEVLNEPTAAAVMYGVQKEHDQIVLVYDLGGSAFNTTVLEIRENAIKVIATGGDHYLGGRNWDESMVLCLAEKWMELTGYMENPADSLETLQDLVLKAERAKWILSARQEATVSVSHEGQRIAVKLTRDKFDELTASYLERTIMFTKDTMDEARKRGYTHFDQILLVGGSSRMPQVRARLEQEFSLPIQLLDPDEAVVKGAAIYAQKLMIDEKIKYQLINVPLQAEIEISSSTSTKKQQSVPAFEEKITFYQFKQGSRPNFFFLLRFDPDERWDEIKFRTVLEQKRREWAKTSTGVGPKAIEAKRYLGFYSQIQQVMADPTERENEANEARKERANLTKERLEKFEKQLEVAQSKGYLEEEELKQFVKDFADVLTEAQIRGQLSVKVQAAVTPYAPKRDQLDPTTAKEIAQKLDALQMHTLYELLGKPPTHSRADLKTLANQLYSDMVRRPPSPETTLKMELGGLAMKVFDDDAMRAKYDATLRQARIDALLKELEEIVSRTTSKEVHESQITKFLEDAGKVGWGRTEALAELRVYGQSRRWVLIAPIYQLRCRSCGYMNIPSSNFCQNCGSELSLNCPNCDKLVIADIVACGYCGFKVGNRFWVDDSVQHCYHLIATKNVKEAREVLRELDATWRPAKSDKRLKKIKECQAMLDALVVAEQHADGRQGKTVDRNSYTTQNYGYIRGLIVGENNTITLIYQDSNERTIPFLPPPKPPYELVGRNDLLGDLKQQLLSGGNLALSALNGLPGVGKTALAIALAYDHEVIRHFSDGILWAGLGREADKLSQLGAWGTALGISKSELEKLSSLDAQARAIHSAIGMRRMLLVIDDAWKSDEARRFKLGGPNCAHVLTTRLPEVAIDFAGEGTRVVHELLEDDGLTLLERFVPKLAETAPGEARELVHLVGGLPLPLILMGNYLRKQSWSGQPRRLRRALDRLRVLEERLKLPHLQGGLESHPSLPEDVPLSLLAVIKISDEALDEEARKMLRALSVFPSKPNTFSEEAAIVAAGTSIDSIDILMDFGLLESSGPERYSLHQAISDYAHLELTDAAAYKRMVEYFIRFVEDHKTDYGLLERETGNILAAMEIFFEKGLFSLEKAFAFSYFVHMLRRTRVS